MPSVALAGTASARTYRAFICYSQQDGKIAEKLHRRLENYRVPKWLIGSESPVGVIPARLSPIFRDCDELAASSDIGAELQDAICASQFLIVLCSPSAAQSRWVNAEIEAFRGCRAGNEHRVLCVILSGDPGSALPKTECFPPALGQIEPKAGIPSHIPLAADFRPGNERREDAELRLIAALLGVTFDDLKRREHAQRVRTLRRALAAAIALVLAFASLTAFAFKQRAEARKSAARAIRTRVEAEKLVDFMIVDLRGKLEALGKLNLLDSANEKVRRYYETIAPEEENAELLHRRSVALAQRGDDLFSKGDTRAALEFYQAARAIRERLTNLEPDQSLWQRDLADIHHKLADTALAQNDLSTAIAEQTLAMSILERIAGANPEHPEAQHDLAVTITRLGYIHLQSGKTGAAEEEFRRAAEIFGRVNGPSANPEWKLNEISALNQLADTLRKTGKKPEAESSVRRAISMNQRLLAQDPENVKLLGALELSYEFLSELLGEAFKADEALEQRRNGLKIARQLAALEPQNVDYQRKLSKACGLVAEQLCQKGKFAEAEPYAREALAIAQKLVVEHPENKTCLIDLPSYLNGVSLVCNGLGRKEEALQASEQAVEVRRKICAEDPVNREMKQWLGYSIYCLGDAVLKLHRPAEAEKKFRESIVIATDLIDADPANLVPLQFRALYELDLGSALRDQGNKHEAIIVYRQCLKSVQLYAEKGGLPQSVSYPREHAEKALQELNTKSAAR